MYPFKHCFTFSQHVVPDWDEYEDSQSGRKFYYNPHTKEKSWKPPRKPKGNDSSCESDAASPVTVMEEKAEEPKEEEVAAKPEKEGEKKLEVIFLNILPSFPVP